MTRAKFLAAALPIGILAACTAGAISQVSSPDVGMRIEQRSEGGEAPPPPKQVPEQLRSTFSALRAPAVDSVPASVQRLAEARHVDALGLAPSLTRAMSPPATSATTGPWYLVPGADSVCLVLGSSEAGMVCTSAAEAASRGVMAVILPPPARVGDQVIRIPPEARDQTFRGVAPSGVTAVRLVSPDGTADAHAVDANGTYDVSSRRATRLELVRADGDITSVVPLAP